MEFGIAACGQQNGPMDGIALHVPDIIMAFDERLAAQVRSLDRFRCPGGRSRPRRRLICAAEGPVREEYMPLRQGRRGAARAVLVSLHQDGWQDRVEVYRQEQAVNSYMP
jgi:hypothetical protein